MEHVIKETTNNGRQFRLTAEEGYLLKSTKSGKTYREIETLDLGRWTVIEDPDAKPAADATGTVTETPSKPKTAKRTNRKEKK